MRFVCIRHLKQTAAAHQTSVGYSKDLQKPGQREMTMTGRTTQRTRSYMTPEEGDSLKTSMCRKWKRLEQLRCCYQPFSGPGWTAPPDSRTWRGPHLSAALSAGCAHIFLPPSPWGCLLRRPHLRGFKETLRRNETSNIESVPVCYELVLNKNSNMFLFLIKSKWTPIPETLHGAKKLISAKCQHKKVIFKPEKMTNNLSRVNEWALRRAQCSLKIKKKKKNISLEARWISW